MTEQNRCIKLDNCQKVAMVLDKDLAGEWQYSEAIKSVCAKCPEKKEKDDNSYRYSN